MLEDNEKRMFMGKRGREYAARFLYLEHIAVQFEDALKYLIRAL